MVILHKYFDPKTVLIAGSLIGNGYEENHCLIVYTAELHYLCKFGPYLNNTLQDQLVCELHAEGIQRRLLLTIKTYRSRELSKQLYTYGSCHKRKNQRGRVSCSPPSKILLPNTLIRKDSVEIKS